MRRTGIVPTTLIATVLAACSPGVVTPAVGEALDSVTPGQSFEVSVVGFSGTLDVEPRGLTVAIDETDAPGGVTVLTGTVPVLPGGTCDQIVTTAEVPVPVEVDVVEPLSGRTAGYYVDDDGRDGEFRFTAFLEGLADADLFDLTLDEGFPTFEDFVADVAAETASEVRSSRSPENAATGASGPRSRRTWRRIKGSPSS